MHKVELVPEVSVSQFNLFLFNEEKCHMHFIYWLFHSCRKYRHHILLLVTILLNIFVLCTFAVGPLGTEDRYVYIVLCAVILSLDSNTCHNASHCGQVAPLSFGA